MKTPRRTYYLTANDNDERTAWISSINDAIEGIKESTAGELFDGKPKSKITFDDFTLLKTIGKGSFGQVIQVCKKDTKKIYAMKVMNKSIIVQKNDTEHIKAERRILEKVFF